MAITQYVRLDVNQISTFSYINAKQGDSGKVLRIRITINGEPYDIPTSASVILRAIKPDNTVIYNLGTVYSDGTCGVTLTEQTLAVTGKIYADVSVMYGDVSVSSVTFVIFNEEFPKASSSITSSSQLSALSSFVSYLTNYNTTLTTLENNKADGAGITVSLNDGILTVKKTT